MAEIIQLHAKDSPVFQELFTETIERLQAAADVLIEDAVNLGMHGPWREWNESQPAGTALPFDLSALAESGDPRLGKLYGLYIEIMELLEELRPAKEDGA